MKCPCLNELPRPPEGNSGWPWTKESRQPFPFETASGQRWPRITVVTPSYNQGRYIEECIRSILLQGYPDIEFIIIDGGSNDETVHIINKYAPWIAHWSSETDKGQSHALNKGFHYATGDIYGYLNSDDLYEENSFFTVAEYFLHSRQNYFIAGDCLIFDETNQTHLYNVLWPENLSDFLKPFGSQLPQPSCFWGKDVHQEVGDFNQNLHYVLDQDFFLRIGLAGIKPNLINQTLSRYRDHPMTKSRATIHFFEESIFIIKQYGELCGLTKKEIGRRIHEVENNIEYLKTFIVWRNKGRLAAMVHFLQRIFASPDFLLNRKVLGQARRLLMFKSADVKELNAF
jgi:glycosyltransferase involved in cell wall biosynthesis